MSDLDLPHSSDTAQFKTRRVTLVIKESEYDTLCRMATKDGGQHPTDYGGNLLSAKILERAAELETEGMEVPHLRTFIADHQGRQLEHVTDALKRIAARHIKNPTEESLEKLKDLCDEEGRTVEEIMEDLKESPAVPVVSNTGDMLGRAINWIIEFMKGKDTIASIAAFKAAEHDGFSKRTIELAKSHLSIPSKKLGGGVWYWVNEKPMEESIDEFLAKTAKK